jgi:adenylylsulfate kinase-like enzyme
MVIWLTGLPGAGKTTLANILLDRLRNLGKHTLLIDGDQIRDVLQMHAYDTDSRKKVALTYARLGNMFSMQGSIAICATVSMFDSVRKWNTENISDYLEVYIKVSDDVLQARNQKGLYTTTSAGEISSENGFNLADIENIETPKNPHLVINNNGLESPAVLVDKILAKVMENNKYDKNIR